MPSSSDSGQQSATAISNADIRIAPPDMVQAVKLVETREAAQDQERDDPDDDESQDDRGDAVQAVILAAPPWLISMIVHMALLLIFGLILLKVNSPQELRLDAVFADTSGEQLQVETFATSTVDVHDESILTPDDVQPVDDPLLSSTQELPVTMPDLLDAAMSTPTVGIALSGREPGMKETLLLSYGGNATTEAAVAAALKWLAKQQRSGAWELDGPYSDGAPQKNRLAATSMALLAFQGAGFTHNSGRRLPDADGNTKDLGYETRVRKGWERMLKWQGDDGGFWEKANVTHPHHALYSQAQATIAICELYAMTQDPAFRKPAQKAVDYAVRWQSPEGGWRYEPGVESDTSVTGWFVMALQSARMAGLEVPSDVFEKISRFLDSVTDDGGSRYGYLPDFGSKLSMTAEALLCRQYMGWKRDDQRLQAGVMYIANNPIDWTESNTYYWYYATQVMHHMEGDYWYEWNRVMAKELPAKQIKNGREAGSWSPEGDRWSMGGRLYMTCLCTYMLEVYYRHLPIYADIY